MRSEIPKQVLRKKGECCDLWYQTPHVVVAGFPNPRPDTPFPRSVGLCVCLRCLCACMLELPPTCVRACISHDRWGAAPLSKRSASKLIALAKSLCDCVFAGWHERVAKID